MATNAQSQHGRSWLDRALDKIKPQPAPPPSPVPPELPPNVQRAFKSVGTYIYADFEICPLKPERTGEMQDACIESAKNLVTTEP